MSCELTEIDLSNVESIGTWAFGGCEFVEIIIPDDCIVSHYAFGYCEQLKKIIVGSDVNLDANGLVYYIVNGQGTDRNFGEAYDGEGTYVFEDGAWRKQ